MNYHEVTPLDYYMNALAAFTAADPITLCGSTFLGVQCERPTGHMSGHTSRHSCGHVTVWTDQAADEKEK